MQTRFQSLSPHADCESMTPSEQEKHTGAANLFRIHP